MNALKSRCLLLLLMACCSTAGANHKPGADWSWHILSASADESRLSVYLRDKLFGIYDLDCDLADASEGDSIDGSASLDLVRPRSNPEGLLVISCDVGAHSQMITIIDLAHRSEEPVFSVTGSYSASWELQDGELWIAYDEPCDVGPTADCPDGFKTTLVQFPEAGQHPQNN